MTAYPLTLTVEYEENDPDEIDSSWDAPHGFAVIRLGRFEVCREPMKGGEPLDSARDDLEHAAARWLARITGAEGELVGDEAAAVAGGQRGIKRMRIIRAVAALAVALNAFIFAVDLSTGSPLVFLPPTCIAALLVLIVMQTRLIGSYSRTQELNRQAERLEHAAQALNDARQTTSCLHPDAKPVDLLLTGEVDSARDGPGGDACLGRGRHLVRPDDGTGRSVAPAERTARDAASRRRNDGGDDRGHPGRAADREHAARA